MEAHRKVDLIIRNGRVLDPANGVDQIADVAVSNGKIETVGRNLGLDPQQEFDASRCLVTPGLIDVHTHVYKYATPLGIDADKCCLATGVTTAVDAGSAGTVWPCSTHGDKYRVKTVTRLDRIFMLFTLRTL